MLSPKPFCVRRARHQSKRWLWAGKFLAGGTSVFRKETRRKTATQRPVSSKLRAARESGNVAPRQPGRTAKLTRFNIFVWLCPTLIRSRNKIKIICGRGRLGAVQKLYLCTILVVEVLPDWRAARSLLLSWREQQRFVKTLNGYHLVNVPFITTTKDL